MMAGMLKSDEQLIQGGVPAATPAMMGGGHLSDIQLDSAITGRSRIQGERLAMAAAAGGGGPGTSTERGL